MLYQNYKVTKKYKNCKQNASLTEGVLIKDKNNIDLLLMGKDYIVSRTIYNDKEWEAHLQNALKQIIKPNNKVLVLGGHIGAHALLISKLVGNDGKVSVFEANKSLYSKIFKS